MNTSQLLVTCILCLNLTTMLIARPAPVLDIASLTAAADLIVAGELTSIQKAGVTVLKDGTADVPAKVMTAELRIDQVLKGRVDTPVVALVFMQPDLPIGYRGLQTKVYRTFFLKQEGKHFRLVSPSYPSIPAVPGIVPQGETNLSRVLFHIGQVLRSPASTAELKKEAIWSLASLKQPEAIEQLRPAVDDNDQAVRLQAVTALLSKGDISVLKIAVEVLLHPAAEVPSQTIRNLAYAVEGGVQDPTAVPDLAKLQEAQEPIARRAAATALARTQSPEAIPGLSRALDDPDFETRFQAVVGLANVTRQYEWKPDVEDFKIQEERYLSHWKKWRLRQAR